MNSRASALILSVLVLTWSSFAAGNDSTNLRRRAAIVEPTERVLIPIVGEFAEEKAYYLTQLWMRNDGTRSMRAFYPFPCVSGEGCPPLSQFVLKPGDIFANPGFAIHGSFLTVAGDFSSFDLTYSLRIENVAGLQIGNRSLRGAELPLVSEKRFRSVVHLLNVPSDDAGLRKVLRIYGLGTDDLDADVEIAVAVFDAEIVLSTQRVRLTGGRVESGFDSYPPFYLLDLTAAIDALQSQASQGRVTIRIRPVNPTDKLWAFVALVDPITQQITAVTPGQ